MRSKRAKFKRSLGGNSTNIRTEYNLPKAATKQLRALRKRLKEEEKVRLLKVVVLTAILMMGMLCLLVDMADGIREFLWFSNTFSS